MGQIDRSPKPIACTLTPEQIQKLLALTAIRKDARGAMHNAVAELDALKQQIANAAYPREAHEKENCNRDWEFTDDGRIMLVYKARNL